MHIVVMSDTHLNSRDSWNADRLTAWDQVITEGLVLDGLAAWVHAGDVFDARSSIQDRNDVAERFQRMLAVAPVLVVQGNHEAPGDLAIFRRLAGKWPILIAEAADVVELPLATGGTALVFALAYPSKGALVAAGLGAGDATQALDVLFMDAARKMTEARKRGHVTFMVGHANITGARSSTGQPMIGQEISVSAMHLARLPKSLLKVFGHIHLPQELHGAIYVGSGARLSWGETEAKRYLVAMLHDDSTYEIESRALYCPPRFHAEGQITRTGITWQVTKGPSGPRDEAPASWSGCDVRFRVRYIQAERALLGDIRQRGRAEFDGARHVDVEPIAVVEREVRAPEVITATSLEDKLKAWSRLVDVSWSDQIDACAQRLLAMADADTVVDEVEVRLNPLAIESDEAVVVGSGRASRG